MRRHPRRLARARPGHDRRRSTSPRPTASSPGGARSSARRAPTPSRTPRRDLPALRENFQSLGLDALVAIGGDDTLGVAYRLYNDFNMPIVGIPKTIDNDLKVTDFTFGFDTAVNIVTEAVDRLRTTAESHRRIMVVETMGRHAGWIACFSGIAVAADYILVPEVPIDIAPPGRRPQAAPGRGQELRHRRSSPKGPSSPTAASSPSTTSPTPSATSASAASATRSPSAIEDQTGLRDPLRRPRPPPARRAPQRLRPRPGHPARPGRRPPRPPAAVRHHGRPLRHQDHRDHPERAASPPPRPSTSPTTTRPPPSSG